MKADRSLSAPVGWLPDLNKLRYKEPLFAPSPAVQVTLTAIDEPEIHTFIQKTDMAALSDIDDDGEHAPLLLETLDLSHWVSIMYAFLEKKEDGLAKLTQAHAVLGELLERDELEYKEAEQNTKLVEAALINANPQDKIITDSNSGPIISLDESCLTLDPHTLLSKLNLGESQTTVSDLKESIYFSQSEQQRSEVEAAGKGPCIPFLPSRAVEQLLATRAHRTWCLQNANLLAPISILMWKFWGNLSDAEVKKCEEQALSCTGLLKIPVVIPNAFPLAMYDHHKCTSTTVQVLIKQDVLTCPPRIKRYSSFSGIVVGHT